MLPSMVKDSQFPIYAKLATPKRAGKLIVGDLIERATGKRPSPRAQDMWSTYGRIPSKFILIIQDEARRRRIKVTDSDFTANPRQPRKEKQNGKD